MDEWRRKQGKQRGGEGLGNDGGISSMSISSKFVLSVQVKLILYTYLLNLKKADTFERLNFCLWNRSII